MRIEARPRVMRRPDTTPTWEDQGVFVIGRLEEAGVPVARRNYTAGELLYASGDPDAIKSERVMLWIVPDRQTITNQSEGV